MLNYGKSITVSSLSFTNYACLDLLSYHEPSVSPYGLIMFIGNVLLFYTDFLSENLFSCLSVDLYIPLL